jgi:hypothetical protein
VLEHIEVLVFNLLAFSTLLAEVDQFSVLFRALDCLEKLTACICGLTRIRLQQLDSAFDDRVGDKETRLRLESPHERCCIIG